VSQAPPRANFTSFWLPPSLLQPSYSALVLAAAMHDFIGPGMLGQAAVNSFFSGSPEPGWKLSILATTTSHAGSAAAVAAPDPALSASLLQATATKAKTPANITLSFMKNPGCARASCPEPPHSNHDPRLASHPRASATDIFRH